jgi:hypothetical protein
MARKKKRALRLIVGTYIIVTVLLKVTNLDREHRKRYFVGGYARELRNSSI